MVNYLEANASCSLMNATLLSLDDDTELEWQLSSFLSIEKLDIVWSSAEESKPMDDDIESDIMDCFMGIGQFHDVPVSHCAKMLESNSGRVVRINVVG